VDVRALAIDLTAPTTLYAAGGTVFKSTDAGSTWKTMSTGLPPDVGTESVINALAIDPLTPTTLYASAGRTNCHNGGCTHVFVGVFQSTDAGSTWNPVNTGLPPTDSFPTITALAIDPLTPTTLYAAGGTVFKSTDGANTWTSVNTDLPTFDDGSPQNLGVLALAIDPITPTTVYAAAGNCDVSCGIFKSTNAGSTWHTANTGLPKAAIVTVAIDPATRNTLYAGTGEYVTGVFGGTVVKSTDAGSTWHIMGTGLPNVAIRMLAIDPITPATLYVVSGNGPGDAGVFKTTDAGGTWNAISGGLPTDINALVIDPLTPNTLYAGTNNGVFSIQQVPVSCVGDCDGNTQVTIDELFTLVNVALGNAESCPSGVSAGATVDVSLIITAVNHALTGCGG
jgi:photosystem II stability/assembly factor-like uncharacterized protein